MSFKVYTNISQVIERKFSERSMTSARRFLANEVVVKTDPFVPFREGYLKNSATIGLDGSFVMYDMPYARRLYYGVTFKFNQAPVRGAKWIDRAWEVNKTDIEKALQNYMERL